MKCPTCEYESNYNGCRDGSSTGYYGKFYFAETMQRLTKGKSDLAELLGCPKCSNVFLGERF